MPKKHKVYIALEAVSSLSQNRTFMPGDQFEMAPEDAKMLLERNLIKEVTDDPNSKLDELGELQDRAE